MDIDLILFVTNFFINGLICIMFLRNFERFFFVMIFFKLGIEIN